MIKIILDVTNMSLYISFVLILINLREYKSILLKGKRAQDDQFPWLIQFQTIAPCGGVLLSSDWVLTAAQCVQDKRNSIILFATGLNGTGSKQSISVKATYIYPAYEAYSVLPDRDRNVALLKLAKPFDMCHNRIILPNVIPVKYDDDYKVCLIFGWHSYVSPSSKILAKPIQYCEVILNSWKMCTYMIKTNRNYTNVFCTMVEFEDEMKACAGNPGSPVICENQNHEAVLVGIASWTNFSLECGNLPTYLDLGPFRIWLNDLVFNNKNTTKVRHDSRSNEKGCMFTDNIHMHDSLWNRSDLLQSDSQINYWSDNRKIQLHNISGRTMQYQEVSTESFNKSYFWNKLYQSTSKDFNDINKSSFGGYHQMSYIDIAKEPTNSVYKYKEIGNSQNNNQLPENLNKHIQYHAVDESLLCNNNQKCDEIMAKPNKDRIEIDDFEFLLPFDFEDVTASYSNIVIVHSKRLYLIFCILFWYLYHYLHIIFDL